MELINNTGLVRKIVFLRGANAFACPDLYFDKHDFGAANFGTLGIKESYALVDGVVTKYSEVMIAGIPHVSTLVEVPLWWADRKTKSVLAK